MKPRYGCAMSTIRNTAPATDNAQTNNMQTTVPLPGARSPNVKNSRASQNARIARKAHGRSLASFFDEQPMGFRYLPADLKRPRLQQALRLGIGGQDRNSSCTGSIPRSLLVPSGIKELSPPLPQV